MKLSLFVVDMIVYMENPIDSTKKLLDLINEFGKAAGYKVNTEKSNTFLYTNTEISETEVMKKSHLLYQSNSLFPAPDLYTLLSTTYLHIYTL